MRAGILAATLAAIATAAAADGPVTGAAAKGMLFATDGADVVVSAHPFLTEKDMKIIEQVAQQQKYYGAVAVSPDDGLMSEATVAAANYHDSMAARTAAKSSCDERRKGKTACVIVAEILPKGWHRVPLQLSSEATEAFGLTYENMTGPKALAISPSTGQFGIGNGPKANAAAIADCAKKGSAKDCKVAISG